MELEFQARGDAEVRARAAEAPEQLRLLVCTGMNESPVCGHEIDRAEAVDRQPEVALEAADTPAEGQPGDAGVTDDADRTDETMLLGCDVELAEERSPARSRDARRGVDAHVVHAAKVDDQPAVGRGVPKAAVTPAADGDLEVPITAESNRRDDVIDAGRPNHDGRSTIEPSRSRPCGHRRSPRSSGAMISPAKVSRNSLSWARVVVTMGRA